MLNKWPHKYVDGTVEYNGVIIKQENQNVSYKDPNTKSKV